MNIIIILLVVFFTLVFLRVPIAFSMALSSMVVLIILKIPFVSVVNQMYKGVDSFALLAVPFFMLVGELMNRGGVTDKLVRVSDAWVGHIRGGLGHVNVMVSMLFAGLSGSAAADTAGIGAMMIPTMVKAGFPKPFSAAITAASSTLGVIIPPSIMVVLYGAMAQVSIGALFWAGIVPGIFIGISQMGYGYYLARKYNYPRGSRVSYPERFKLTFKAIPTLMLPAIILGGISFGIFTATEAAAIAVGYGFILIFVIYKDLSFREIPEIFRQAAVRFSMPLFAVSAAGIMGWVIAYLDTPQMITHWVISFTTSYYGIYGMIILMLLIIGTFLSPIATIVIFTPIIGELGQVANLDPIHLGLIVNLTLALGMITPPYGICLLIASEIAEISVLKIFLAVIPMFFLALGLIILGVIFPDLYLFLPKLVMPGAFH